MVEFPGNKPDGFVPPVGLAATGCLETGIKLGTLTPVLTGDGVVLVVHFVAASAYEGLTFGLPICAVPVKGTRGGRSDCGSVASAFEIAADSRLAVATIGAALDGAMGAEFSFAAISVVATGNDPGLDPGYAALQISEVMLSVARTKPKTFLARGHSKSLPNIACPQCKNATPF